MDLSVFRQALSKGIEDRFKADAGLFGDEEYSDLTIICGDKVLNVHKAIVCKRSAVLRAACRKGAFEEGENGMIKLAARTEGGDSNEGVLHNPEADDPEAIEHMIRYLYFHDYPSDGAMTLTGRRPNTLRKEKAELYHSKKISVSLTTHANVFAAAIKHDLPALRTLAAASFLYKLDKDFDQFRDLAAAIPVVFTTTPSDVTQLREPIYQQLLHAKFHMQQAPEVEAAIKAVDGLSFELFKRLRATRLLHDCAKALRSSQHDCEKCGAQYTGCYICVEHLGCTLCSSCSKEAQKEGS